jgi:ribosome biogenesis GTPase A
MLACVLAGRLRERYASLLITRYKLKPQDLEGTTDFELAELIGRRRGFLISGGEVDFLRTSNMFLDEFRGGKIGRITIETPEN